MSKHVTTLFEQARVLTADEREDLVELLLGTLESEADSTHVWSEEAHRRWEDHVAGGGETVDAFEAIEQARGQLKRTGA